MDEHGYHVLEVVETVCENAIAGSEYEKLCERNQSNPRYITNQIAAMFGELASGYSHWPYVLEKIQNVERFLESLTDRQFKH